MGIFEDGGYGRRQSEVTSNGRWITDGAGRGGCNGHPSGIREVGEMPNLSVKTIVKALLMPFFLGGGVALGRSPEKWWLEDYFPFVMVPFQGLC